VPFYQDSDQVCDVMTDLFQRTLNDPDALRELNKSGMVLRLNLSDPSAILTVDGKVRPPWIGCGPSNTKADLVMNTQMDVIHHVWLGNVKLKDAFFGGQIKVQGSILRAMSLGGLFREIEALYPFVLRDRGMLPGT
jgi:hypothetical protein